jgi:hypothetical protein
MHNPRLYLLRPMMDATPHARAPQGSDGIAPGAEPAKRGKQGSTPAAGTASQAAPCSHAGSSRAASSAQQGASSPHPGSSATPHAQPARRQHQGGAFAYRRLFHPFASNVPDIFLEEHAAPGGGSSSSSSGASASGASGSSAQPPPYILRFPQQHQHQQQSLQDEQQQQRKEARQLARLRASLDWETLSMGRVLESFYPRKHSPGMSRFGQELGSAEPGGAAEAAAAAGLLREAQQHLRQEEQHQGGVGPQGAGGVAMPQQGLHGDLGWRREGAGGSWGCVQGQAGAGQPGSSSGARHRGDGLAASDDSDVSCSDGEEEEMGEEDVVVEEEEMEEEEEEEEEEGPSSARQVVGAVVYGYWSRAPFG